MREERLRAEDQDETSGTSLCSASDTVQEAEGRGWNGRKGTVIGSVVHTLQVDG